VFWVLFGLAFGLWGLYVVFVGFGVVSWGMFVWREHVFGVVCGGVGVVLRVPLFWVVVGLWFLCFVVVLVWGV